MAYNPIKRLRSWFFDNNIPTEPRVYTDANGNSITKQVKTRLAKGHFAKEETFKDLLETTFMKSSGSDLQDVASTQEIYDEVNLEKVVKPNQLPELENTIDTITYIAQDNINLNYTDTFSGNIYTIEKRKNSGRNKYSWKFSNTFLGWLLTKLLPKGGSINQVLTKSNNADFAVEWSDLPVANNGLPPFVTANSILFTNATNDGAEWRNRDYYNQTEINGFRSTDNTARINGDALLQTEIDSIEIGTGLNSDGTYSTNPITIINTATSLNEADILLATNLGNLNTSVNAIRGGATLPTSSLQGLQTQINNLGGGNVNYITLPTDDTRVINNGLRGYKIGNRVFIEGNLYIIPSIGSVYAIGEPITYTISSFNGLLPPPLTQVRVPSLVYDLANQIYLPCEIGLFSNVMRCYVPNSTYIFTNNSWVIIPNISYLTA